MKRSHLVDAFLAAAWYLHDPIHDRLSHLLHAHLMGHKDRVRIVALEDDGDSAPAAQPAEDQSDSLLPDGVALIDVRGVLAMHADEVNGDCLPRGRSYDSIREQLALAIADPAVMQIVLRLETPGGIAIGCQETFDAIRAADEVKPVRAFVTGYCFSAGMFLAAACRSITAESGMTYVGSIGTIASAWDTSAAAAEAGLRRVVWRAGAYKALIQDGEAISDQASAEEQRMVDAFGAAFHDAVRAGRGLNDDQAEAVLNGRTFLSKDAVALGLVDQISTFPAFLAGLTGTEPVMFGRKKTSPASAGDPTPTQPAAAGIAQESTMDPKLMAALAALSDSHPTHAPALIKAAALPGATEASLRLLAAQLDNTALTSQLTAVREQLAAETAKVTTQATEHAKTIEAKDKEIAKYKALAGIAEGAPKDVGGGAGGDPASKRQIPLSRQSQMTEADHADVRAGRAMLVDDVSKRHTAAQSTPPATPPATPSAN